MDKPHLNIYGVKFSLLCVMTIVYYFLHLSVTVVLIITIFLPISLCLIFLNSYRKENNKPRERAPDWLDKLSEKEVSIVYDNSILMAYNYFSDTILVSQSALDSLDLPEAKAILSHETGHSITSKYSFPLEAFLHIVFPIVCFYSINSLPMSPISIFIPYLIFEIVSSLITYISEIYADYYSIKNGHGMALREVSDYKDESKPVTKILSFIFTGYPTPSERRIWIDYFSE